MRLQERIKTTQEPVVGLRHVQEFLTESDPEMEPHYQCGLCGSQGTSNSMFSHLMGGKHRQKTAEALGVARGYMSQVGGTNFIHWKSHLISFKSNLFRVIFSSSPSSTARMLPC